LNLEISGQRNLWHISCHPPEKVSQNFEFKEQGMWQSIKLVRK